MPRLSRTTRKSFKTLLLERGKITDKAWSAAETEAGSGACHPSEILIRNGAITEDEAVAIWVELYGLPFLSPIQYPPKKEAAAPFPAALLTGYCVCPLDRYDTMIVLAAGTGLSDEAVDTLEETCGMEVMTVISRPSEVRAALQHLLSETKEGTA